MVYSKSNLKKIIKLIIIIHLVFFAAFGMVKCTRITILSSIHSVNHIKDTELLFHIIDFVKVKNYVYNTYLEESRKDKSVEEVSLYASTLLTIYHSDMPSTTKLLNDNDLRESSISVYNVMKCGKYNNDHSGDGLTVRASDNLVTFDSPYYNYMLVYSVNGMYPDKASFSVNHEFVRISVHWFHCYYNTNDFWAHFFGRKN